MENGQAFPHWDKDKAVIPKTAMVAISDTETVALFGLIDAWKNSERLESENHFLLHSREKELREEWNKALKLILSLYAESDDTNLVDVKTLRRLLKERMK